MGALLLGAFTSLYFVVLIITVIVGLVERISERKPVYLDPDKRLYYARNRSIGYRFLVRTMLFGGTLIYLPVTVFLITLAYCITHDMEGYIAVPIIFISTLVSLAVGIVLFCLSFKIKLTSKVDHVEVDQSGFKVVYRKKDLRESLYPIAHFKGYEGKRHDLFFSDSSGNNAHISTSYLGKRYSVALGNDLIALRNGKQLNKVPVTVPAQVTHINDADIRNEVSKSVPAAQKIFENKEEHIKPASDNSACGNKDLLEKHSGIPFEYGPLKTDISGSILSSYGSSVSDSALSSASTPVSEPSLSLISGTEENVREVASDTKSLDISKTDTSVSKSSADGIPDLSSAEIRIYIKNSYRTDIQKTIDAYKKEHSDACVADMTCDSYPGSSWMFVGITYGDASDTALIFWNCMEIFLYMKELKKEMILFARGKEECLAYVDGGSSDDNCSLIYNGSSYDLDVPVQKMTMSVSDASFDDIRAYIKSKYCLDV